MRETEIKFSVHASFMVPGFEGTPFHLQERPALDLRATYHDTTDLRLARHGATLRYRTGEAGGSTWTLKLALPGADARVREERNFSGPSGTPPAEARDLVTAFARTEPLAPVARLRTKRRNWEVVSGEEVIAELSDDEVSILEGRRVVARFREVELESKNDDLKQLEKIAGHLRDAGAVEAEPIPKAVRALGPLATAGPDVPTPSKVKPSDPAGLAVRSAIAQGVRRVITSDPLARLGEVEGVHQMRVGARRIRSDLRTFSPLVNENWREEITAELKWLADTLGEVRDLDVQQARLRSEAKDLGESFATIFAEMVKRRTSARAAMEAALTSDRYKELLERLIEAAQEPALTTAAAKPCEEVLPPLVESVWNNLKKHARELSRNSSDESFHAVRIRAKRTRYAAEAVGPALGKKSKDALLFADLAAAVQEELGSHQDATVAQAMYYHFAAKNQQDGPLCFSLGRLVERQAEKAHASKDRFFSVWDELDRKKNVRWLA